MKKLIKYLIEKYYKYKVRKNPLRYKKRGFE
jgi:hypothetical protein